MSDAPVGRLRVIEHLEVGVSLDPYLDLKALSRYSGLSVRKLRDLLANVQAPLPSYRVDGKILVRVSEFDHWIAAHRARGRVDVVDAVVRSVLGPSSSRARSARASTAPGLTTSAAPLSSPSAQRGRPDDAPPAKGDA